MTETFRSTPKHYLQNKESNLQNSITLYGSFLCLKANLTLIQYLFQSIPVGIRDGSWPNFALFLFHFIS